MKIIPPELAEGPAREQCEQCFLVSGSLLEKIVYEQHDSKINK